MRFEEWKLLKENLLPRDYLSKEAMKDKKTAAEKFKDFYAVPDFEAFKRPGEPTQQSNLFTDDELNTFSFNYSTNGNLYSIDIWKGENPKPVITYYVKKGGVDEIVEVLPDLIKGEKIKKSVVAAPSKEKVLRETSESLELDPEKPKPETPVARKGEKEDEYDFADPETIFHAWVSCPVRQYLGVVRFACMSLARRCTEITSAILLACKQFRGLAAERENCPGRQGERGLW